jgi:hypothetical protein
MASGQFQVTRSTASRLTLRLTGVIDEETVLGCERETRARTAVAEAGSLQILWDLRGVEGYSFEARIVLVRLQRFLAARAQSTVYVADALAARSLALWSAHMGGHGEMCITADVPSALAWLAGDSDSNTTGRHLIHGAPARAKDKAAS